MISKLRVTTGLAALAIGTSLAAGAATHPSTGRTAPATAAALHSTAHLQAASVGRPAKASPTHDDRGVVHATAVRSTGRTATAVSNNWAGMAAGGHSYQGVYATWVQPRIAASSANRYSCTWVGIDGATNQNLIQTGTEADTVNGVTKYYAWMEILPATQSLITYTNGTPVPVKPGDSLIGEVVKTATAGVWQVYLKDVTQNWVFQKNYSYSGAGASAEWIQEATQEGSVVGPPANFGTVTFNNLEMAYGGQWYYTDMTAANGYEIVQNNHVWAYPSAPSGANTQSISVYYNG